MLLEFGELCVAMLENAGLPADFGQGPDVVTVLNQGEPQNSEKIVR
ncbi:hypothetical protein [Pseudomonas rhodesiae]|nr:hypothetical protein [Pseudomonas rhodesiae]